MLSTDGFVAATSCSNSCCDGDSFLPVGFIFSLDDALFSGVI